ncbi:thymidine phosphorylase [Alsobacter metallidurans]|uniref:Thymidine phosphorylase n=1 Tax=Alsobacter metallidurans TaxID=340221 RepID=A0A917I3H1_9HYPH|nr:thymidine phosphorylase [Alsobacter metallidurans]GGH08618.1 thymidine phosphorylase [Alsobacter metallidurans]
MIPQEIIRRKRDGEALAADEIAFLIRGLVSGAVTEGQAAAFAMAVFFQGMSMDERVALTRAMVDSGVTMVWPDLDGPVLDKHSTGGIGDNVSLMLAPAVAACGGFVPMISGRGLGHTGGTLDKLDSIPGYASQPDSELFRKVVAEIGCAIIGQTADLAPADKRLYGIRDVTATVESIPLITASILSKKLAAGLEGLVMDVKTGNGAFMDSFEGSAELAESLAEVATGAGLPTTALITAMDQPLASAAGNAVEVRNAVRYLTGEHRDERLHEVVVALGGEMLLLGDLAESVEDGWARIDGAIQSGQAAEIFGRMVAALGGPVDFVSRVDDHLPAAPVRREIRAGRAGFVSAIDTRGIGVAVVGLGGGRTRPQDAVDHAVGFTELASLGQRLEPDALIGVVHARTENAVDAAAAALTRAYALGDEAPEPSPAVLARFAAESAGP